MTKRKTKRKLVHFEVEATMRYDNTACNSYKPGTYRTKDVTTVNCRGCRRELIRLGATLLR